MPVINIREQKKALRARYKKLREACPPAVKQELDRRLRENFLSMPEYRRCETLFSFVSEPVECDTRAIIEQAFRDGKRVAVPKCLERRGEMAFFYIRSFEDTRRGAFGITEPDEACCERVTAYTNALCIVPGLCFDLQHYRVGFGGGYYDRFLERFRGITAGICFSRYTLGEVPRGAFDRRTDILVTEKFIDRNAIRNGDYE